MRKPNTWPPFIPAVLDDAKLSLAEFRIVCRISRRAGADGECWESAAEIVKGCRIHKNTVWKSLKNLIALGMVKERKRAGQTTVFTLSGPDEWIAKEETTLSQKERQVACRKRSDTDLSQKERHEGSPLKGKGQEGVEKVRYASVGEAPEEIEVSTY